MFFSIGDTVFEGESSQVNVFPVNNVMPTTLKKLFFLKSKKLRIYLTNCPKK